MATDDVHVPPRDAEDDEDMGRREEEDEEEEEDDEEGKDKGGGLFDDDEAEEDAVEEEAEGDAAGVDGQGLQEGEEDDADLFGEGGGEVAGEGVGGDEGFIDIQVAQRRRPLAEGRKLVVVKLPMHVGYEPTSFNEATERRREKLHMHQMKINAAAPRGGVSRNDAKQKPNSMESLIDPGLIRWRPKRRRVGEEESEHQGSCSVSGTADKESNSWLVEWSDGTYGLFVGSDGVFECKHPQEQRMHVLEDSDADVQVAHAVVDEMLTFRPYGLQLGSTTGRRGAAAVRGGRTKLTTAAGVRQSEIERSRRMESDSRRTDRRMQSLGRSKGLSADFLEEDGPDLMRIRQQYGMRGRGRR